MHIPSFAELNETMQTTKFIILSLLLFASAAIAHGGRLDGTGGHTNRKTNEYHCHREPCFSNHKKSVQALQEAKSENRAYSSTYNRKDWPHWLDYDHDCQNARAEELIKSSSIAVKFKRNKGCVVSHGRWHDPYSGKTFTKASQLDIDHIVPLKEAHISGGSSWSRKRRRAFANDPENLIVVSAHENREKGAKDLAKWLPDVIEYRCQYVKRWVRVKARYSLNIDQNERSVIDQCL